MQPLAENLKLIDREMIAAFLEMLFRYVDGDYAIMLRGIGEAGTAQEGVFRDNQPFQLGALASHATDKTVEAAERWGQHHVATFIVPAALHPSALDDRKGTEDRIALFTSVMVDLDKGDTEAALAHLRTHIGPPTMVVASGGTTDTGQAKLHVWWSLKEPTAEIERVGRIREAIALKVGGDPSFKRPAQVVRVPGTVYAKGGVAKRCAIVSYDPGVEIDFADLADRVFDMPPLPGIMPKAPSAPRLGDPYVKVGGGLDFSGAAGLSAGGETGKALVEPIHAGGEGDATRWSRFSQVWGHYLHCVREGEMTLPEADAACRGWVAANMVPPWPAARLEQEMAALAKKDVADRGPFPAPAEAPQQQAAPALPVVPAWALPAMVKQQAPAATFDLEDWDVGKWVAGEIPRRRFLVQGLIQAGKPHILAAEGGAGKTGQALDLALKLASYEDGYTPAGGDPLMWWGQMILPPASMGKVVFITAEDDKDEMHIRLRRMDGLGLVERAAGRLKVLPLVNVGGAFPFIRKDGRNGEPRRSDKWDRLFGQIAGMKGLTAVIIDTLNSTLHGEDTRPDVIQEYFNEANQICGQLGAALIVTHHIRKAGKVPIQSIDQMRDAVRGSSALPAAVRAVIGFWHAHDYEKRMKVLGLTPEPKTCYRAGVVKANNEEFMGYVKTLLRDEHGTFLDKSREEQSAKPDQGMQKAWIVAAVRRAAIDRFPFWMSGAKSLFGRRAQLHECLRDLSRTRCKRLMEELAVAGLIVQCEMVKPAGTALDVPDGPVSKGEGYNDKGSWATPDWTTYHYMPATQLVAWPGGSPEAKRVADQERRKA